MPQCQIKPLGKIIPQTMRHTARLLQLLMLVLGCLSAGANTLYVTNYASIQATINAAVVGDTVYFPNGIYDISSSIKPKSGIILTGQSQAGVLIRPVGAINNLIDMEILTKVEISYLTLDGYNNTSVTCGIYAYQGGNHYLHNLTIQNLLGSPSNNGPHAIHFNGINGVSNPLGVTNCVISNNSITNIGTNYNFGCGIRCSWGSANNTIIGNTIALTGRGGIFGDNYSSGMVVRSNNISGTGLCPPSTSGYAGLGIEEWNGCDGALIEDNTLDHWLSIYSSYAAVRRNTMIYLTGPVIGAIGLEMAGGTNCLFTDNLVNSGQQIGISVSGGPNTYIYWCSNNIQNMVQWAVQDQGPCYGHYFYGNKFLYTQTGNPNAIYPFDEGDAFRMNGTCTNITLEANIIQSSASAAIEFLQPLVRLSFVGNTITSNNAVENSNPTGTTDLLWTNNTVSNNKNNVAPVSRGFTSDQMPVAAFTAPGFVLVGQPVAFTNTSTAPGSAIANTLWDLGEGLPLTVTNPVFTYATPGTYRVSLLVWNTQGRCARAQGFVSVSVPPPILSNPIYSNNQLVFEVSGTTNHSYIVQGSTDLINWVNLQTNAAPFMFTNSVTSNFTCRFYRGVP